MRPDFGSFKQEPLRILDFDSECRPMHYSEWRSESQITAIAWSWVGEGKVHVSLLEPDLSNEDTLLDEFLEAYAAADIVTGHYILRHDLPLLNDHALRAGPPLAPKLASDTKVHFPKVRALGLSQENLGVMYGLDEGKHHMTGASWRVANSLSPEGLEETRRRVVDDVRQHKALRAEMVRLGALKPPVLWKP